MSEDRPNILAIDAASRFGWACGRAGERPVSGSARFAEEGADQCEIFAGAIRWTTETVQKFRPDQIVIEAPLAVSLVNGRTNLKTTEILMGLPACIQGMACILQISKRCIWVARVSQIRKHFIGKNIAGDEGKDRVWRKCIDLGWVELSDDDVSKDRTDALAIWSFAETLLAPKAATPVDDLWVRAQARARAS